MRPVADPAGLGPAPVWRTIPVDERMRIVDEADVARWWPVPDWSSDKYSRGVVGLHTGSRLYPGAAILSCAGALGAGAGMVRYLGASGKGLILGRFPSVVTAPGRVQAHVVGSGWGEPDRELLRRVRDTGLPVVADADALAGLPEAPLAGWLLTPHAGELARLLGIERGAVTADPVGRARAAAAETGAAVLLKGSTQLVAEPDGRVTFAVAGPAWTAQAGSGDVLAGAAGSLLAAGLEPWRAGVLAASLQAMAAGRHPGPLTPDALAARFPAVIGAFSAQ